MIEKQQFLNWLKKRNIYDSYMRSFNGNQVLSDKIFLTFDEFFDYYQTEPRKFLFRAFDWQETSEGYDYWDKIDDDWFNFCEECIEKT